MQHDLLEFCKDAEPYTELTHEQVTETFHAVRTSLEDIHQRLSSDFNLGSLRAQTARLASSLMVDLIFQLLQDIIDSVPLGFVELDRETAGLCLSRSRSLLLPWLENMVRDADHLLREAAAESVTQPVLSLTQMKDTLQHQKHIVKLITNTIIDTASNTAQWPSHKKANLLIVKYVTLRVKELIEGIDQEYLQKLNDPQLDGLLLSGSILKTDVKYLAAAKASALILGHLNKLMACCLCSS